METKARSCRCPRDGIDRRESGTRREIRFIYYAARAAYTTQMLTRNLLRFTMSRDTSCVGKQRQKTAAPTDVGCLPPRRQPVQASRLLPFWRTGGGPSSPGMQHSLTPGT
ncbi:unnamed protein product [Lasius platythorax]|uniref:Uncharacterized protein n=1 Tax=Lasius platythorax TaxID=488582 RepID=A0AAV2NSR8_9HYME